MSKITFRADDHLIDQIESLDDSKSEIMRNALRTYLGLDANPEMAIRPSTDSPEIRNTESEQGATTESITGTVQGIDVTVRFDPTTDPQGSVGVVGDGLDDDTTERCAQCGEPVGPDHGYCPNCGSSRSRRILCECGDELRADWSFCPGCGRRTPTAEVLDRA